MNKILSLLLLCFLLTSCIKVSDGSPNSDYTFEVSCHDCTISVRNGNDIQSYHVYGYQAIPMYNPMPFMTVTLWTNYDKDWTNVRFVGHGANRTLFNDYLYYNDPSEIIQFYL